MEKFNKINNKPKVVCLKQIKNGCEPVFSVPRAERMADN
jgi:hypothetical protein